MRTFYEYLADENEHDIIRRLGDQFFGYSCHAWTFGNIRSKMWRAVDEGDPPGEAQRKARAFQDMLLDRGIEADVFVLPNNWVQVNHKM